MDINNIKNISPGRQLPKKIFAIILSILIIAAAFMVLNNAGKDAKDTVDVVRLKSSDGMPANTVLTSDMVEKYSIIRKEFNNDMVMYKDVSTLINKYSLYFLRGNSVLYKDQFSPEKPLRNEWLYAMDKNHEVLTLPYDYMECGGDILVPGDFVKIRVSYDETTPEQLPTGQIKTTTTRKTDLLLESIKVTDILNSKGHSIYEVYKEVQKLSQDKKDEAMKSKDFIDSIVPKSLVLEGTPEQVDKYARYKGMKNIGFLYTILSRKDSKNNVDQLPTMKKEIESWIQPKN